MPFDATLPLQAPRRRPAEPRWLGLVSLFSLSLTMATVVALGSTILRLAS